MLRRVFLMPSTSPFTRQSMGRTFLVSAGVLAVVGVVQFSAVGVAFFRSIKGESGERHVPQHIDVSRLIAESPPPPTEELSTINPLDDLPADEPAIATPPVEPTPPQPDAQPGKKEPVIAAAPPRPTPVPLSAFTPKLNPQLTELVEQAKLLRNKGDTAGALVKLREAAGMEPGNPLPIAETAYTYEKMSLPDKAAVEWKRILQMGERAGLYYSAAKSKLDIAMGAARSVATVGSGAPEAGGTAVFAEGRVMALGGVRMLESASSGSGRRFSLAIPIYAKEGAIVNPRKEVVTHVRFYDLINSKEIVPTTANVAYRFASPPADWTEAGLETLEVDYELAQTGRDDPAGEGRRYYGYIVRVFHKGTLQASFSEPATLAQKFPATEK